MTTAHRPTFNAAIGGEEQGGHRWFVPSRMQSAKDQPGYLKMKMRQTGQNSLEDIKKRDLEKELAEKESKNVEEKRREEIKAGLRDEEEEPVGGSSSGVASSSQPSLLGGKSGADVNFASEDPDVELESDSSDSDSDSDSDEDEEELQRQLDAIRKERALENARKEQEAKEAAMREQEEAILMGNPLMHSHMDKSYSLKRRWDDDVPFKNQARDEPETKKRFINDTIRSDFHKKFMNKYMR